MDVTCNVIDDLLPLYADGICTSASRELVEKHFEICSECRRKITAMTADIGLKKTSGSPGKMKSDPFRKTAKHYFRLIIVTLCLCAAVFAPAAFAAALTINEEYHTGMSWTSIKVTDCAKKFASLIKEERYAEALENVEIYTYGASEEDAAVLKAMLASDLKTFFGKHSIKKTETEPVYFRSQPSMTRYGTYFAADLQFCMDIPMYNGYTIRFFMNEEGKLCIITGENFSNYYSEDTAAVLSPEEHIDLNGIYGYYLSEPRDFREFPYAFKWFGHFMETKQYDIAADFLTTREMFDIYAGYFSRRDASYWKECSEKINSIEDGFADSLEYLDKTYGFAGADCNDTYYAAEPCGSYNGFFKQNVTLYFGDFNVTFDSAVECFNSVPVENIVYSANTPDGFKRDFEAVFA